MLKIKKKESQNLNNSIDETTRRLPVYLVLDCSESMVGEGIEAVQNGVESLVKELNQEPQALETAWLSIITFSNSAEQIVPLIEIDKVQTPSKLKIRPGTKLGEAFHLLQECIKKEVRPHTETHKGDWRPLIFLLTDGEPTDAWEIPLQKFKQSYSGIIDNIIAIGCGPDVDIEVLNQITADEKRVLLLKDYSSANFKELFKWITSSIATASQGINEKKDKLDLAYFPKNLLIEASRKDHRILRISSLQKQLFLAVLCSKTIKPYLIRYKLDINETAYIPIKTHMVDPDYMINSTSEETRSSVPNRMIKDFLPCPYCENDCLGQCPYCNTIFCYSGQEKSMICPNPNCNKGFEFSDKEGIRWEFEKP